VTLVIVNWNGVRFMRRCLQSVLDQDYGDFAVIVVDNGSTDGSCDLIRRNFPQVQLIQNAENVGFAVANNQAIEASRSEFVATLNNDTWVSRAWLGALVQAMERGPRVGMCASRMLLASQAGLVDSLGIAVDRLGFASNVGAGQEDIAVGSHPGALLGPCAGAALYRRAMLDEIGLFDEDFFMYLEDADLAWRAQWAGWQCHYAPEALVYHVHSGTAQEGSSFKHRLLGRNKVWMVCKNYPFPPILWYAPAMLLVDILAVAYAALVERQMDTLLGRLEALGGLFRMLSKRSKRVRRVSWREMTARLQPVEGPLAMLRRYGRT
jgi:GT2 family glycosyltransferase